MRIAVADRVGSQGGEGLTSARSAGRTGRPGCGRWRRRGGDRDARETPHDHRTRGGTAPTRISTRTTGPRVAMSTASGADPKPSRMSAYSTRRRAGDPSRSERAAAAGRRYRATCLDEQQRGPLRASAIPEEPGPLQKESVSASATIRRPASREDTPELRHRRAFTGVHALDPVAERLFDDADVADEVLEPRRLQRCGVIGTPHRPIKGDVPLDGDRTQGDGGDGDLQAAFVSGISDRDARVAVAEQVIIRRLASSALHRIGRRGVQEDETGGTETSIAASIWSRSTCPSRGSPACRSRDRLQQPDVGDEADATLWATTFRSSRKSRSSHGEANHSSPRSKAWSPTSTYWSRSNSTR